MGFDEWYLPKKHFLDDCESGYFECYEAGAASRQAEVDALSALSEMSEQKIDDLVLRNIELQKNFDNALKTIEIQQRFLDDADGANKFLTSNVDELQKRIDDAMKYVSESPLKDVSRRAMLNFLDILKGKKDE